MTGDGITRKSSLAHNVVLKLAGEALSSHEVPAAGGTTSKSTCHMKGALEFGRQPMCNIRIEPIVGGVAVTRIAAATVETQTGKEVRVTCSLPRAGSNDTIGEDASQGNARAIVNEGVDGLMWSPRKAPGRGRVQLEEQYQGIVAREFSPKKYWRLLKDVRNVGDGGKGFPKVVAPSSHWDATKGWR